MCLKWHKIFTFLILVLALSHSVVISHSTLLRNVCPISFSLYKVCILLINISVQFSQSVVSDSLQPYGLQHTRPLCLSPTPRVYANSCPLSQWCHPTISSSVVPFSSHLQSFPASGSFQMSQLFTWGGQSIEVSASTSLHPVNTQDWSPLGWTGWISLQSKGLSRVFSNTRVQKHKKKAQFKYISPIKYLVLGDFLKILRRKLSLKSLSLNNVDKSMYSGKSHLKSSNS